MAKILIAEDERDIRDLIAFTLRFAGHEVFAAANGEEVVDMGIKVMPDLFVLDVRMPRMTGYEACRVIKHSQILKHIPVVFLSARGQESEINTGLAVGGYKYLLKPFSPDSLTSEIKSVVRLIQLGAFDERKLDSTKDDVNFLVNELKRQHVEKGYLLDRFMRDRIQINESPKDVYPLAELSRITDGIVHDMRNGLGIIRNTIGFMGDDLKETAHPHSNDVLKISRSLDFCEVVLRNLSALGGQDILRPGKVNLETLVQEICFMLENKLVDVKLAIETDEKNPIILADEGHMKQVFMNLIKNAGEAMADGGTLTCRFHQRADMMHIEISDTGQGISNVNQRRLFREFFTTKERGYGIGLFVVHSIIERHGGKISVKSKIGKGTTFTLLLPIKEE